MNKAHLGDVTIEHELKSFKKYSHHMQYKACEDTGLPADSGLVEGANKTLIKIRGIIYLTEIRSETIGVETEM